MSENEPENFTLHLLREIRAQMATKNDIAEIREQVATKEDLRAMATKEDLRSEINSLRADVAADILSNRKDLSEQIVGLRRAVIEYHSAVIGHGVIISGPEARVRRLEQHLKLEN
jgi:hypothetical protein